MNAEALKSKWRKEADDTKREMDMDEQRLNEKCQCAYCKEGISESASECVDRMVEVSKRLREHLNKFYNTTREEKDGLKGNNKS